MKNKNKRDDMVCSKRRSAQLLIAIACSLMLSFFTEKEMKAQVTITSITSNNIICNGLNSGSATVNISGGAQPIAFFWSDGQTNQTASGLAANTYTVTVKDKQGYVAVSTTTIYEPALITLTTTPVSTSGCNSSNGSARVDALGGVPGYTYNWSNGAIAQQTATGLSAGLYTVTVTDANGCSATTTTQITQTGGGPDASFSISPNDTVCVGAVINFINTGGMIGDNNDPFKDTLLPVWTTSYLNIRSWTRDFSVAYLATGTYTVRHILSKNGCHSAVLKNIVVENCGDGVWPGDADNSGKANMYDMLAVGLGYGDTGTVRPGATINWVGQACGNWTQTLPGSGTNEKHTDCNGDGTIDFKDTTAIVQNYGLTHALKLAKPEYINGLPDLTYTIPVDTALSGTTIKVPIDLGSSTNQANNVYGLAFSITYDPKIVDTSKISLSLNGSWLGTTGTDLIYITKNFGSMGRMDVGITRIDHQNISGFGKIGDLGITLKDDVALKSASTIFKTLTLDAIQIKAIDKDENLIQLNVVPDNLVVGNAVLTGINKYNTSTGVKIYPNPASGIINLDLNSSDVNELKLVNIIGETVWQQNNNLGNKIVIDTQTLPAGTYYLSVTTSQERMIKQVNVIK